MIFYNVENLFDTEDDPVTNDSEFLPKGERFWSERKFDLKLKRIYQTIMAASEGSLPVVVGLCEIENRRIMEMLLSETPLGKMGYNIIHQESPDHRGIDVALLYNTRHFIPLKYQVYPVKNPEDDNFTTRDILHAEGVIEADTFHLFVNHWPSKYGGVIETKPLRALAAQQLKHAVDSLFTINQFNVIIMGDFNDSPIDESLVKHLGAKKPTITPEQTAIYNLSYPHALQGLGTNKYQGKWEVIDQFIVGGNILITQMVTEQSYKIFKADFLLEKDKNYLGVKPFRTYIGYKYNNGFSDHLPVILDLNIDNVTGD
ncbi:MAG: endonuclease [Prolixibacteraceae bacterium]|nr:endonuclease [Prolixibacteraceae bacterium]